MPPSHSLAAADTKTRGARAAHLLDICAYSLRAQACGQSCNAKRVESSLLRQALPPIHCCSESRFFQGSESAWPVQNTSAHSRGSARVTAADASRCVQTDRRSTRRNRRTEKSPLGPAPATSAFRSAPPYGRGE